jgi:DNA-binding LacI/PurR family transcriptional regulator
MKKGATTIRDVAAAAGVSVATVSKFMNGTQRFSAPVEARLKEAVEKFGYRSNPLARSMITGETRTIGVAVSDIRNPNFTDFIKGANRIALQRDYALLLVDTEESGERERPLIESLARRVDGMIVSSRMRDDSLQWLVDLDKPLVLLGRSQRSSISSVGTDDFLAGHILANHLRNLGHRRLAYLGFAGSRWNDERIRGIKSCLHNSGLMLDVRDVSALSPAAGESVCSAIMLGPNPPDGVICYNDLIALGFMKEARELGFRLPHDVSVAGLENVPYGEYVSPALTTIDFQSEKMGELAMTKLIEQLNGACEPDGKCLMLEPRLIVRESITRRESSLPSADIRASHVASISA